MVDFIRHILRPKRGQSRVKAAYHSLSQHVSITPHRMHGSPYLKIGHSQSVGMVRKRNQDTLLTITTTLMSDKGSSAFGLFIVADGMGGHRHGGLASKIAVQTVGRRIVDHLLGIQTGESDMQTQQFSPEPLLRTAILHCHKEIENRVPLSGTTITAALVIDHHVSLAHVGDSRAYMVEDDSIKQLTSDHSLVQRLVDQGQITSEEANNHPRRNVLYRAVGQGTNLDVDLHTHTMPEGGKLLLCSDGLWGMVDDSSLARIISATRNVQETCERLVQAANHAGGTDNITAVLIQNGLSTDYV